MDARRIPVSLVPVIFSRNFPMYVAIPVSKRAAPTIIMESIIAMVDELYCLKAVE